MGLTQCDTTVFFPPSCALLPGSPPPFCSERQHKVAMYRYARTFLFWSGGHWREMLDDWYCEAKDTPMIIFGINDPRNADIASNSGFRELLAAWVAENYCGTKLKTSKWWSVDTIGFHWDYQFPIPHAGGFAAYTSATNFLGSYDALLTVKKKEDCLLYISVMIYNETSWPSACGTLDALGGSFCSYAAHDQKEGPFVPSRGGNLDQYYLFDVKGIPIAKECSLCVTP